MTFQIINNLGASFLLLNFPAMLDVNENNSRYQKAFT